MSMGQDVQSRAGGAGRGWLGRWLSGVRARDGEGMANVKSLGVNCRWGKAVG